MRALTILQPWASLIAIGAKPDETRGFAIKYRGPLLIHAGKNRKIAELEFRDSPAPFSSYLTGPDDLPYGAIVAVAELWDCMVGMTLFETYCKQIQDSENPEERTRIAHNIEFGNFGIGRYAWRLRNVTKIDPIPCNGSQGLWIPSKEIQEAPEIVEAVARFA